MAEVPEGWYPDPTNPDEEIFWQGQSWSGIRRPRVNSAPPATPSNTASDGSTASEARGDASEAFSDFDPKTRSIPATPGDSHSLSASPAPKSALKPWAVAFAIVAIVTAVIPGASLATWVFAIPAISLGLVSLLRSGKPRGQALFATIGGSLAWLTAIIVSIGFIAGLNADGAQQASNTDKRSTAAPVEITPKPTAEELAEIAAQEAADEAAEAAEIAAAAEAAAAANAAAAEAAAAAAAAEEAARGTVPQQNALRSAGDYLDYSAFSRSGLIRQLEFEGFSTGDATWGVDRVGADWNAQAANSAKAYLEYTSFSRSGLIDQLVYEGFSAEQAEFGVSQTGL